MELALLRGFHYWSKATVTLCMSVSAVTLFSPKTIAASDINTHQYFIVLYTVCVCECVTIIAINNPVHNENGKCSLLQLELILNNHVCQTIVEI